MSSALQKLPSSTLAGVSKPTELLERANRLNEKDRSSIDKAFSGKAYEMAMTFVWARTMTALRQQLEGLGGAFIGEMLERDDWTDATAIDQKLTDGEALRLSAELGLLEHGDALRLRHAFELLGRSSSDSLSGTSSGLELTREDAVSCLRACVSGVLSRPQLEVPKEFSLLRNTLLKRKVEAKGDLVEKLVASPYFFIRTIVSVLTAGLRSPDEGVPELVGSNIREILPDLWPHLQDPQKWQIGRSYAGLHSEGRTKVAESLRLALSSVKGFDFVPENLRADAFRKAATELLSAHNSWNNFYNEPGPARALASLGSSVPSAALGGVARAAICSYLGNGYGVSRDAQPSIKEVLGSFRTEQWEDYLEHYLPSDQDVLAKLQGGHSATRWPLLVESQRLKRATISSKQIRRLIEKSGASKIVEATSLELMRGLYS